MTGSPRTGDEVPAFLCVDVEPDTNTLAKGEPATWLGYDAIDDQCAWLRGELEMLSGAGSRFSWFFRMDPQIATVAARADHAVSAYQDRIERFRAQGDGFGVHVHPLRWFEEHECWIDDYIDRSWNLGCIESSVQTFTDAFGSPPDRHRYGGGYFHTEHVALVERLGVRLDLTLERRALVFPTHAFPVAEGPTTRRIGRLTDCTKAPLTAYRPAQQDALQADDEHGRNLVMIPLSAKRGRWSQSRGRRASAWLKRGMRPAPWRVLYAVAKPQRDPLDYWNDVASSLRAMPRPYVAIAVRTNAPDSPVGVGTSRVLEALPEHPLAKRLRFVDPVDAVPALLAPRARAGLTWSRAEGAEPAPR